MNTFKLTIARLDKELFSGDIVSLTVPSEGGEMTLLAKHEPIIAKLKSGKRVFKDSQGNKQDFELKKGILEMSENQAHILLG